MVGTSFFALSKRIWQHIYSRRRLQLFLLFVLMIIASIVEILSIGSVVPFLGVLTDPDKIFHSDYLRPFIKILGLGEPQDLLIFLSMVFALCALASGATRTALLWSQNRLCHAIGKDISMSMYRRTLYQPYAVHVARNSSEIIAGITGKANGVIYSALLPMLTMIGSIFMLAAIMATLIVVDPFVALAAFVGFGSAYSIVMLVTRKRLGRYGQSISLQSNQVIKALQEGLGGIRDVLLDGTQDAYCKIYQDADQPLRRAQSNVQIITGIPRFGIEALGMVLIAILACYLTSQNGIAAAIPILGALAVGAQRLLPVLQQAYSSWTSLRGGEASLKDALELLEQPLPDDATYSVSERIPFQKSIELHSITFRYSAQTPYVLRRVDVSISKGSRIGFIGSTGSGKSTLLDIVMGLLNPTEGILAIDGLPITQHNYRGWQMHIAHVPQSIFLADSSIAENIAFGVPLNEIDIDRVREVARQAQIADAIKSWPMQYETMVGERGVRLSGGQRQRIGIARALYKNADVIVFDEATSALDTETEMAVMQAIENLGQNLTIIIVAHRVATLKNCTQIIELSAGEIKRIGGYSEIFGLGN